MLNKISSLESKGESESDKKLKGLLDKYEMMKEENSMLK